MISDSAESSPRVWKKRSGVVSAGRGGMEVRLGVPASGGLAAGPAHLIVPHEISEESRNLAPGEERAEARRFRLAVRRARDEIAALRECLLADPDDAGLQVLDAHQMLLDDQEFQRKVLRGIREERHAAGTVLRRVFQESIGTLESAGSEYFRARSVDLRDVLGRVVKHLEGGAPAPAMVPSGSIVVAVELSPSETTSFNPETVRALVTDHGGPTSHAAILARSRGIPAVVGLVDLSSVVRPGDWILVDGHRGRVVVRPDKAELNEFETQRRREQRRARALASRASEPAVTRDGQPVTLQANIEVPEDVPHVIEVGADGIGLYRTEFFYLSGHLPDEEGQYRVYRRIASRLRPHPVTIRTLDAGGDKFASYLGTRRENNPFLGVRGIRFSLLRRDIFRTQLRAILRASAHGHVRILFPMVSSLEEVREADRMLEEASGELRREGHRIAERIERGIMIEVPAAVGLADFLARETDFFSIGSNDLIQYTLAVDRENEKLAHLYDPFHPAVLRALSATIEAAQRARIPVSSCGEMSGSPLGAAVLLGLGCMSLSMSPFQLREVKDMVRHVRLADLRRAAQEALRQGTVAQVRGALQEMLSGVLRGGATGFWSLRSSDPALTGPGHEDRRPVAAPEGRGPDPGGKRGRIR